MRLPWGGKAGKEEPCEAELSRVGSTDSRTHISSPARGFSSQGIDSDSISGWVSPNPSQKKKKKKFLMIKAVHDYRKKKKIQTIMEKCKEDNEKSSIPRGHRP